MSNLVYKPANAPYLQTGFMINNYATFGHQNQTSYGGYRHLAQAYTNPTSYDKSRLPFYGKSLGGDKFFTIDREHTSYNHHTLTLRTHTSNPVTGQCTYVDEYTFITSVLYATPRALVRYDDTHYVFYATTVESGVSKIYTYHMHYKTDNTWHIVESVRDGQWGPLEVEYNLANGTVVKTTTDNEYVRLTASNWSVVYDGDITGTTPQEYGDLNVVSIDWDTGVETVGAPFNLAINNTEVPANRNMSYTRNLTLVAPNVILASMYFKEDYRNPAYFYTKAARVKNVLINTDNGTLTEVQTRHHYWHSVQNETTGEYATDATWIGSGFPTESPIYAFSFLYAEKCALAGKAMTSTGVYVSVESDAIVYNLATKDSAQTFSNIRALELGGGRKPDHINWFSAGANVFDGQRVGAYTSAVMPQDEEHGYVNPIFYTGSANASRIGRADVTITTDSGWGYVFWNWYYAPNFTAQYSNQATHLLRWRPWLPEGNSQTIT